MGKVKLLLLRLVVEKSSYVTRYFQVSSAYPCPKRIWSYKFKICAKRFSSLAVLYCIVVGSRRLMPPDALQPKAYCTNPGLQSFLLAPPGVSTREPSSERRNYLGEKWPVIWTESCDFHANMRHGKNGFISLPKEGVLRIFSP